MLHRRRPLPFSTLTFFNLAKTKIKPGAALTTAMLVATWSFSQQAPPTAPTDLPTAQDTAAAKPAPERSVTVPAGTSVALVLTHPIQTRYIHRGDDIYAQIISPITVGNEVLVPAGTLVQGKVDKIDRKGQRGELHLQSLAITFPDGYVAAVGGPLTLETSDGYALQDPGEGRVIGAFAAPMAGAGLGALIGHSTASSQGTTISVSNPPGCIPGSLLCSTSSLTGPPDKGKDTVIGAAVGGGIGFVASLALMLRTHNFFLDVGSPVEMILERRLVLASDQVSEAVRDAAENPGPEQPLAPRPRILAPLNSGGGTCYTPGTPGIDIPGTPAIGGAPGTPPTHIPGSPPTPYPCP